ncbi:M15 family metallopeptidase [Aeromicrobium sp. Leaf350]|uniref:M15 family metallopeptidase n=1 Tax=Aeromicrobium sp. Leaf350 TaxID=2876565 RepID=UPI001E3BA7AC|nr:M15 family metallopeptidase [Aeromicrobium sp. Leaf350]
MTIHAPRPVPAPARTVRRRRPTLGLLVLLVLLVLAVAAAGLLALRVDATGSVLPHAGSLSGDADGDLPDEGVSPTDTDVVGVSRLDPDLLDAVQRAAVDAAEDGIELRITSAWRSAAYQQQLLDEAIASYGDREARRIVQTPDRSRHVTGDAVDVGPTDAAFWVLRHGSDYGLCQVYANEVWHYELLTEPGGTCPPLQSDAS